MSIIKKTFDIWSDLEVSYDKFGKGLTRAEFMRKLISYKSMGDHGINYIMKNLNDNLTDSSDDEQVRMFSLLIETFKTISNYLDKNGLPLEIDNLNAFLIEAMGLTKNMMTKEDIVSLYNGVRTNYYEKFYKQMIIEFGCVTDYICYVKNRSDKRKYSPAQYVGIENVEDKFRVIHEKDAYNYILENNKNREDAFTLECITVLAVLAQNRKLEKVMCISNKDNVENSKLFGVDIEFVEIIRSGDIEVCKFTLNGVGIFVYAK